MPEADSHEDSNPDLIWDVVSDDENSFVMSGCHTVADWKAGIRLASNSFLRILFGSLIAFGFVLSTLLALVIVTRPHPLEPADQLLLGVCLFLMALTALPTLINGFRVRRMARRQEGIFTHSHSVLDSRRITTTVEGSKTEHDWSAFSKVKANDKVALLFFKNPAPPLLLARRKLQPPATWNELLDFLESKVPE